MPFKNPSQDFNAKYFHSASEQCFSSANMLIASNSGKSYDSFVLYITNLFLNMLSIITEEKKVHMGDGAIGHTIQRHHSQRSKKTCPVVKTASGD